MANTIKVKRSSTTGAQPTTAQLDLGEIAINTFDGKMFIKKNNGTASIVEVGGGGGGATNLDGLSDVAITSAARGQVLAHNGTEFVNTNTLQAATSSTIPLIAKGAVGHNTDFFRVTDSNNNLLSRIDFQARGWFNRGVLCTGVGMGLTQYDVTGAFLDANAGSSYAAMHLVHNSGGYIDIAGLNQDYHGRLIYDIASSQWSFYTAASATQRLILGGTTQSLQLNTVTASTKGILVKGAASQSANLFEGQNSSGVAIFQVGPKGSVYTYSDNTTNFSDLTFLDAGGSSTRGCHVKLPCAMSIGALGANRPIINYNAVPNAAGYHAKHWQDVSWSIDFGNIDDGDRVSFRQAASAVAGSSIAAYQWTTAFQIHKSGTTYAVRSIEAAANTFATSLAPSSGTLTIDTSTCSRVLGTLNASVTTWAFTNVPTDNSKVTKVTAVIAGNTSYTYGDACSVNGSAITDGVQWSGGSAPTSTSGTDIIEFVIVKDSAGTIKVFGSAITNYS